MRRRTDKEANPEGSLDVQRELRRGRIRRSGVFPGPASDRGLAGV
jgi:hypothetical protein